MTAIPAETQQSQNSTRVKCTARQPVIGGFRTKTDALTDFARHLADIAKLKRPNVVRMLKSMPNGESRSNGKKASSKIEGENNARWRW